MQFVPGTQPATGGHAAARDRGAEVPLNETLPAAGARNVATPSLGRAEHEAFVASLD